MRRVIASIGIPGSGKTTALKPWAREKGYVYICPDDIRQQISGDVRIQSDMRQVWDAAYARMRAALADRRDVVFDATQYKPEDRLDFTKRAKEYGATEIIGVYFDVPLALAKERNSNRERVVPEHALRRMHQLLAKSPPRIEEGFDAIGGFEILET